MSSLKISLLGSFNVTLPDGATAQFESDAARLLLAYLALNTGSAFRRESLADLLWPDQPGPDALHALRQTLTRLRKAIGDDQSQAPLLSITRQAIAFNSVGEVWMDTQVFSKQIEQTRLHQHKRIEHCQACLSKLREATLLYRGDLLKGMHLKSQVFEEWLLVQREQFHRQALNALFLLANSDEQHGAYASALAYARRQVELEPWREEAHRQLMRSLTLSGERSAAMKQYELCRAALEQELSAEPEPETEHLYQLIRARKLAPGTPPHYNLPAYLTPFIGRQAERQAIAARLNHPDCRLLTLLGPGGIGKTRLAVQAALDLAPCFRDGVAFVSIPGIQNESLLIPAIAQALQLQLTGVTSPAVQLNGFLRNREVLLVLDGFEHLTTGAVSVVDLLRMSPGLSILITSRDRLNVAGEWVLPVSGLSMLVNEEAPEQHPNDAIHLFIESTRRIMPHFEAAPHDLPSIEAICRAVDGSPLAIELAAGWTPAYTVAEIAREINRDLDFLATSLQGIPAQHRSLRAVFDTSWARLSEIEQSAMGLLSAFPASFDRPAAQQIAGVTPDLLIRLVNQSLLHQETTGSDAASQRCPSQRYQMHETIRRFATEKSTDLEGIQASFSQYYLNFLANQAADLDTSHQPEALARIEDEIQNIKLAWAYAAREVYSPDPITGQADLLERLGQAGMNLFTFLDERCRFQEGAELFGLASGNMAQCGGVRACRLQARFMACQAWFAFRLGQQAEGQDGLKKSLSICQQHQFEEEMAFVLERLGAAALHCGLFDQGLQYSQESLGLYRQLQKPHGLAVALATQALVYFSMGQFEAARTTCQEALGIVRQAGGPYLVEANCLRLLGNVANSLNYYTEATSWYEQALAHYRALGNRWGESAAINNLGSIAGRLGQYARARECFEQVLVIKDEIGDQWGVTNAVGNLGVIADEAGDYEDARLYYHRALALCHELNSRNREGRIIHNLANTYIHTGQLKEGMLYLEEAIRIRRTIGDREGECRSLDVLSQLHCYLNEAEKAFDYAEQSLQMGRALGNRALQAYSLHNRANALLMQNQLDAALMDFLAALGLRREMGEQHLAAETLANIGHLYLLRGDLASARPAVDEAVAFLEKHTLEGTENPFFIYLACIRVLQACSDQRAEPLLRRALTELEDRAARLRSKATQQTFLHAIPSHHQLWLMGQDSTLTF